MVQFADEEVLGISGRERAGRVDRDRPSADAATSPITPIPPIVAPATPEPKMPVSAPATMLVSPIARPQYWPLRVAAISASRADRSRSRRCLPSSSNIHRIRSRKIGSAFESHASVSLLSEKATGSCSGGGMGKLRRIELVDRGIEIAANGRPVSRQCIPIIRGRGMNRSWKE